MTTPSPLPTGNLTGYSVQIMNDVKDFPPHTFLVVTGPDKAPHGYGFAPGATNAPIAPGQVFDNTTHPHTTTSGALPLSGEQYNRLANFINDSIANPPRYNVVRGQECTVWAVHALKEAGLVNSLMSPDLQTGSVASDVFQTLALNPYAGALHQTFADTSNAAADELTRLSEKLGGGHQRLRSLELEPTTVTVTPEEKRTIPANTTPAATRHLNSVKP